MAIAQRKPFTLTTPDVQGPRAKSLRPFERKRAVSAEALEALAAFERAAIAYAESARDDAAYMRLRVVAGNAMDHLAGERDALPEDLRGEIDRWEEGEFAGTRADVELANYALSELLDSDVRVGEPPPVPDDEL